MLAKSVVIIIIIINNNNNNNLLFIGRKLACEYDQMRLTIRNLYNSKFFTVINQTKSNQMLVFGERGKPEYPEKNLSEQSREPTNSAHIWRRVWESNPGHIGGRRALSPLRQPCVMHLWKLQPFTLKRLREVLIFIFNLVITNLRTIFFTVQALSVLLFKHIYA